jgi:hypothetical protein
MEQPIETKISPNHIYIRTPRRYAMGLAIDLLNYFYEANGFSVKNTGWRDGFGLVVCERYPISSENLLVELETDGEELEIHLVSGGLEYFSEFTELVLNFTNGKNT